VRRFVRIQPYDRDYLRLTIPAAAAAVGAWATARVLSDAAWPATLLVPALVGTILYATVLPAAGLAPEERRAFRRLVGSLRSERSGR
jgi:hypothetical protein